MSSAAPTAWRNRIVRSGDAALSDIVANPGNWRATWYNSRNANCEDLSSENVRAVREIASPAKQSDLCRVSPPGKQAAVSRRRLRRDDRPGGAKLSQAPAVRLDADVRRMPGVRGADTGEDAGLPVLSAVGPRAVRLRLRALPTEVRRSRPDPHLRLGAQRCMATGAAPAGDVRRLRSVVQGHEQPQPPMQHGVSHDMADAQSAERTEARRHAVRGLRRRDFQGAERAGCGARLGLRQALSIHPGGEQAQEPPSHRPPPRGAPSRWRRLPDVRVRSGRAYPPHPAEESRRLRRRGEPDYALPEPSRDDSRRPADRGRRGGPALRLRMR